MYRKSKNPFSRIWLRVAPRNVVQGEGTGSADLRQQYTNPDNAMICQICNRRLSFDLDNGTPYLEKVEFSSQVWRSGITKIIWRSVLITPLCSSMRTADDQQATSDTAAAIAHTTAVTQ